MWDQVWIVNGHIEKADGNFLGELFYTKIGDTRVCLGTYPATEDQVSRLKQAGITGVLCLMKPTDFKQRGVKLKHVEQLYNSYGIKFVRFAVNDIRE